MKKLAILTIAIVLLAVAAPAQAGPDARCRLRIHAHAAVVTVVADARLVRVGVISQAGPADEVVRTSLGRGMGKARFPAFFGTTLTDCRVL
jgi:uncharacterized protein YggE